MVDELQRRLADALDHDAGQAPVQAAGLLDGARLGARRIRRRRAAGTAALIALVLVAVPLGSSVLAGGADPGQVAAPAPGDPSGPRPSGQPAPSQTPTLTGTPAPTASFVEPVPGPVPPAESPVNPDVPDGLAGTVLVPPGALLGAAELPFTPTETNDYGPYLKNRTLVTSLCGDGAEPGDDLAVGGRQIFFVGDGQDSLATVVRVFAGDGARQQMEYLRASLGSCSYVTTYEPQDAGGLPGDDAVVGTAPSAFVSGGTAVVGAVREGNTTAGIQIDVDGDAAAATAVARVLLTRAHERLVASGLPAEHPG